MSSGATPRRARPSPRWCSTSPRMIRLHCDRNGVAAGPGGNGHASSAASSRGAAVGCGQPRPHVRVRPLRAGHARHHHVAAAEDVLACTDPSLRPGQRHVRLVQQTGMEVFSGPPPLEVRAAERPSAPPCCPRKGSDRTARTGRLLWLPGDRGPCDPSPPPTRRSRAYRLTPHCKSCSMPDGDRAAIRGDDGVGESAAGVPHDGVLVMIPG